MFLFLDLETTGLKADDELIVELACVAVDERTMLKSGSLHLVLNVDRARWSQCVPFVLAMHKKHGLMDESIASTVTIEHAEGALLRFIRGYEEEHRKAGKKLYLVLAGSSVHFDRRFIEQHMPLVYEKLFYRQYDVSSLYPLVFNVDNFPTHKMADKENAPHRAMEDIQASIGIAQHYKDTLTQLVAIAEAAVLLAHTEVDVHASEEQFAAAVTKVTHLASHYAAEYAGRKDRK